MKYTTPSIAVLGSAHALTLAKGGDNDPKNDQCNKSNLKCLGVGDGRSQESGWS